MEIAPLIEFLLLSFGPGISCMATSGLIFVLMSQLLILVFNNLLKHDLNYHKLKETLALHTIKKGVFYKCVHRITQKHSRWKSLSPSPTHVPALQGAP